MERERPRVRPTRLAPIAIFLRAEAEELIVAREADSAALSHVAREVAEQVRLMRAPFFAEIVRATKRLPSEVEEALWQLVAAGLVTADGFDALRSLSDAKRPLGRKGPARASALLERPLELAAGLVASRSIPRASRDGCSSAGASSSATSSRARASRRAGASCC